MDHWHVAFGIWLCDHYLDPIVDRHDGLHGIHTHGDGLIHIHPTDSSTAGANAILERFGTEVGLELHAGKLGLPDGTQYDDGDQCTNGPGRLSVHRWAPTPTGDATPDIFTDNLNGLPLRDRDAVAIVFAPESAVVPPPPSVYALDSVDDIAPPPNQTTVSSGPARGPLSTEPTPASTPATAPTTSVPPITLVGTRDSFAVWLVDETTVNGAGGCPSLGLKDWRDPAVCYLPVDGAARVGPEIVAESRAKQRDCGDWYIQLTLTPLGLDRFNQLVSRAWREQRQLAWEFGGRVLAAPTVQIERFAATDEILLSAPLGERNARSIAKTLNSR